MDQKWAIRQKLILKSSVDIIYVEETKQNTYKCDVYAAASSTVSVRHRLYINTQY